MVEIVRSLPDSGWTRPVRRLRDLEMYLPVKQHRTSWSGGPEILVLPLTDNDETIRRRGGTLRAFDSNGRVVFLSVDTIPQRPVIAIVPVERSTIFALDGQKRASTIAGTPPEEGCAETAPGLQRGPRFAEGDPPCEDDPPPTWPSGTNVCGPRNSAHTQLYVCRIEISNIDSYEGWPRGNPEIALVGSLRRTA